MTDIAIDQAIYRAERDEAPRLIARSPEMAEEIFGPLAQTLAGFGQKPPGIACPGALFAQPLGDRVAIVDVRDAAPGPSGWTPLRYHVLVLSKSYYEILGGDPFALAKRFPPPPTDDVPLETLQLPPRPISVRSVEAVRDVLKRIKANALPDNFDPTKPPPLTAENAESPTLLGGVQILVDGGKLIFERSRPDPSIVEALWTLLPHRLRPQLWPATFAWNNDLHFDVLVVPNLGAVNLEGYTTEDQAGDAAEGSYELALQTAAENGDPAELETVFQRRTSNETLRLAIKLLVGVSLIVLASRFVLPPPSPPAPRTDPVARAATVAGIVGVHDPITALTMIDLGKRIYK